MASGPDPGGSTPPPLPTSNDSGDRAVAFGCGVVLVVGGGVMLAERLGLIQ